MMVGAIDSTQPDEMSTKDTETLSSEDLDTLREMRASVKWNICFQSTTTYLMPGGYFGISAQNGATDKLEHRAERLLLTEGVEKQPVGGMEALLEEREMLRERRKETEVPDITLDAAAVMRAFKTNGAKAVIAVFTKALQGVVCVLEYCLTPLVDTRV